MKEIILTQGKVAIVDDDDFEDVNKYKWCFHRPGYAVRSAKRPDGKKEHVLMHRFIMNTPAGMVTDHKDLNKLNNQKSNLRICTNSQNIINKPTTSKVSRFKGVSIVKRNNGKNTYYRVHLKSSDGKKISQYFPFTKSGEIEAAKKYNELALTHHKEFAYLNDITQPLNF